MVNMHYHKVESSRVGWGRESQWRAETVEHLLLLEFYQYSLGCVGRYESFPFLVWEKGLPEIDSKECKLAC